MSLVDDEVSKEDVEMNMTSFMNSLRRLTFFKFPVKAFYSLQELFPGNPHFDFTSAHCCSLF